MAQTERVQRYGMAIGGAVVEADGGKWMESTATRDPFVMR